MWESVEIGAILWEIRRSGSLAVSQERKWAFLNFKSSVQHENVADPDLYIFVAQTDSRGGVHKYGILPG